MFGRGVWSWLKEDEVLEGVLNFEKPLFDEIIRGPVSPPATPLFPSSIAVRRKLIRGIKCGVLKVVELNFDISLTFN